MGIEDFTWEHLSILNLIWNEHFVMLVWIYIIQTAAIFGNQTRSTSTYEYIVSKKKLILNPINVQLLLVNIRLLEHQISLSWESKSTQPWIDESLRITAFLPKPIHKKWRMCLDAIRFKQVFSLNWNNDMFYGVITFNDFHSGTTRRVKLARVFCVQKRRLISITLNREIKTCSQETIGFLK